MAVPPRFQNDRKSVRLPVIFLHVGFATVGGRASYPSLGIAWSMDGDAADALTRGRWWASVSRTDAEKNTV